MSGHTYGQYCGLARALDVVGDRWNLLIVRELLIGPSRFGQLRAGLPTIATNLLTGRLKDLERHGVIERGLVEDANAIAYALTPWGRQLQEPIEALIRWSTPIMRAGRGEDSLDPRWLIPALHALLVERRAPTPATVIAVVEGASLQITVDHDGPYVQMIGEIPDGATVLRATAEAVLALAAGEITADQVSTVEDCTANHVAIRAVFGDRVALPRQYRGR